MDDSDSGGLMSTEEEQSGESSGSTGHVRMEKKISKLKMKLKGFEQVSQGSLHAKVTDVLRELHACCLVIHVGSI